MRGTLKSMDIPLQTIYIPLYFVDAASYEFSEIFRILGKVFEIKSPTVSFPVRIGS